MGPRRHAHATVRLWRSENSLRVLSLHHVGPGAHTRVFRLGPKPLPAEPSCWPVISTLMGIDLLQLLMDAVHNLIPSI